MADTLFFRKGSISSLNAADVIEGSICITTDEPGIYYDTNGKHNRIGDLVCFDTWVEAESAAEARSFVTTALYYIKGNDEHILAKFDGTQLVQLNSTADLVSSINSLKTAVGSSSDAANASGSLYARIAANKAAIATLNGDANTTGSVAKAAADALASAKSYTDTEIAALESDVDNSINAVSNSVTSLRNSITGTTDGTIPATLSQLKADLDAVSGGSGTSLSSLNTRVTNLETSVGSSSDTASASGSLYARIAQEINDRTNAINQTATNAANDATSKANTALSDAKKYADSLASNYDAAGAADAALASAKTYADEAVAELETTVTTNTNNINANANSIASLKTQVGTGTVDSRIATAKQAAIDAAATDATTKADTALSDAKSYTDTKLASYATVSSLNAEISRAQGVENGLNSRLTDVEEDLATFFADADFTANAKDTLKELQEYITSDAAGAATMTSAIADNSAAITAETNRATTAETTLGNRITALEGVTYAAAANTNITVSNTNSVVTIGMEWGTF